MEFVTFSSECELDAVCGSNAVNGVSDRGRFRHEKNFAVLNLRRHFLSCRISYADGFWDPAGNATVCFNNIFAGDVERIEDDDRNPAHVGVESGSNRLTWRLSRHRAN